MAAVENGSSSKEQVAAVSVTGRRTVAPGKSRCVLATFDLPYITFYYNQKLLLYRTVDFPDAAARITAALSDALRAGGGADDPACHWLYDTLLFPDPDLRLASASLQPVWQAAAAAAVSLASLYGRVRASPPPSSRRGARRLAGGAPAVGRRGRRRSSRRCGPAVGGAGVHRRRVSGAGVDRRHAQDAGKGHSGGRGR